jgi:hypothetical protein
MNTMENLNEMGLLEMAPNQLKETDGGLIMYPGQGVIYFLVKMIKGAYEKGHDDAQKNCECNN